MPRWGGWTITFYLQALNAAIPIPKVTMMWKYKLVLFLLVIACIVSSFSMIREELDERKLDAAFQSRGEAAEMVMRNYTQEQLTGGKTPETKRVIATVQRADLSFKTKSGKRVLLPHYLLSNELVEKYNQGGPVDIVYLPEANTTIRLAGATPKRPGLIGVSLFGLAGLFMLYLMFRPRRS